MNELLADLADIGLIVIVVFVGLTEYVYWRFGFDKIVASLESLAKAEAFRTARIIEYARKAGTTKAA